MGVIWITGGSGHRACHSAHLMHRLELAHRTAVATLRSHRWLIGNYLPAWPSFLGSYGVLKCPWTWVNHLATSEKLQRSFKCNDLGSNVKISYCTVHRLLESKAKRDLLRSPALKVSHLPAQRTNPQHKSIHLLHLTGGWNDSWDYRHRSAATFPIYFS